MGTPERIWLLRHAETTAPHVFNGAESDVPLSALGFLQAEALAEWFVPLRPTAVVSSTMIRAIQTAAPIARDCAVPHSTEPLLRERGIGALSGTPFHPTLGPWAETVRAWSAGNTSYTTPGAESFDDLKARLHAGLRRALEPHPGGRVVVVAHGIVCKVLLLTLLRGWDVGGWESIGRVANAAISELVPAGEGVWHTERLLEVPMAISRLNPLADTAQMPGSLRSEA